MSQTPRIRDDRQLRSDAAAVLAANDRGRYTVPSGGQYPHQWNWDSALISLGLSYVNVDRALAEIESLLSSQWDDGMIPHIVFHNPEAAYFPDSAFWQTGPRGRVASSGITNPPLIASCLRRIAERHDVLEFVRSVFPALAKWHRWFHTVRDVDGTGLAAALHPWETGTDDSPRWLDILSGVDPQDLPAFERADRNHVVADQRPNDIDYDRFVYLIDIQRRHGWNQRLAADSGPFCAQDVLTNAILLRSDEDLLWLGGQIGEDDVELRALSDVARASYHGRFWDADRGLFLDYDVRGGRRIGVNTAATFLPLWAGVATPEQAELLIAHLRNPDEYWFDEGAGFLLTTTARNEPAWSPVRYWRGPVWVVTNWLVEGGLRRYGFVELADRVRSDTLALIDRHGFVEYYDPVTGAGYGAPGFSWSAALTLDLLRDS